MIASNDVLRVLSNKESKMSLGCQILVEKAVQIRKCFRDLRLLVLKVHSHNVAAATAFLPQWSQSVHTGVAMVAATVQ